MIKAHTAFLLEKLTLFLNPWQGERFPFPVIMVLIADNRSHSWAQIIADFYVPITELHTHEIFLLTDENTPVIRYTVKYMGIHFLWGV